MAGVAIERFRGIHWEADASELGPAGAAMARDVILDGSTVRVRPGLKSLRRPGGGAVAVAMVRQPGSYRTVVLEWNGSTIGRYVDENGAVITSSSSSAFGNFVYGGAIVAPDGSFLLMPLYGKLFHMATSGTWTVPQVVTYDGTPSTTAPAGCAMAVTPVTRRVMYAGFGTAGPYGPAGASATPSRIFFSEPGDALTFVGTNWIDVGDTLDAIWSLVRFRNYVLIFKARSVWVYTGEGTLSDGTPTFQTRLVHESSALIAARTALGERGVYFADERGVWRSDGSSVERVSGALGALFSGAELVGAQQASGVGALGAQPQVDYFTDYGVQAACGQVYVRMRLMAPGGTSGPTYTFVYDERSDEWSVMSASIKLAVGGIAAGYDMRTIAWDDRTQGLCLYTPRDRASAVPSDGYGASGSVAISGLWCSGALAGDSDEAVVRELGLWGNNLSGCTSAVVGRDELTGAAWSGGTTAGGTGVQHSLRRSAYRGYGPRVALSGAASGDWRVNRVEANVFAGRPAFAGRTP